MKAGRKLDALIAEKVMGFSSHYSNWKGKYVVDGKVPHYSTQIADAKQVLDKMIGNGYAVEIMHDCVAWNVCFVHLDTRTKYHADWKNSLETQICLAA